MTARTNELYPIYALIERNLQSFAITGKVLLLLCISNILEIKGVINKCDADSKSTYRATAYFHNESWSIVFPNISRFVKYI
jgi:hypothetical protein